MKIYCKRIKTENDKLKLLNGFLAINNSQLAQKNQGLATESEKLKNEHKIGQKKFSNIKPVSARSDLVFAML